MTTDTVKTDIIISIHPKHVKNIVSRAKDHEYRKYLIPTSVRRMWIYETSPLSAIKYVALISNGKRPGEVANNEGLRNKEFNDGKLEHLAKYAYEILELYTLPEVLPLAKLITNGWLKGPPQKFCYAKRQMVETTDCLEKKFVSTSAIVQAGVIQSISSATLPLPPKEKGSDGDGSHKRTYDAFMSAETPHGSVGSYQQDNSVGAIRQKIPKAGGASGQGRLNTMKNWLNGTADRT